MSKTEFRKFWIRVGAGNSNSISVGRGDEEEPFIHKTFEKRYAVFYTAFTAFRGKTNHWKITEKMNDEVKEISTTGPNFQFYRYYCYNKF